MRAQTICSAPTVGDKGTQCTTLHPRTVKSFRVQEKWDTRPQSSWESSLGQSCSPTFPH